jgi:hypothetical protein
VPAPMSFPTRQIPSRNDAVPSASEGNATTPIKIAMTADFLRFPLDCFQGHPSAISHQVKPPTKPARLPQATASGHDYRQGRSVRLRQMTACVAQLPRLLYRQSAVRRKALSRSR